MASVPGAPLSDADQLAALLAPDAMGGTTGEKPVSGFNLRYVLAVLRANQLLIAAIIAAALLLALIVTMLDTPRYTATTTVQINDQSASVLGQNQDNTLQEVSNTWDTDRFLQTQLDVLHSRGLSQRVAQSLKLSGNAEFFEAMEARPPSAGSVASVVREDTISMLQGGLKADLPRNSRIVSISFESANPDTSAKVANAFAREFIAATLQRRYDSTAYAREFVAGQLAEAKGRLETSEIALNNYARQAGLIRTRDALGSDAQRGDGGGSVTTASLVQLNAAANDARASRIAAEGRWRAIASGSPLNSAEVLANPSVQSLLTRRAELRSKLEQERARHLAAHPTVIQLTAEANEIERQLNALVASVRQSVKAQYDAAITAERQLGQQVSALKSDTLAEQDSSVQYGLIARETDTNRTIYDGLLQRYKELNAAAGISASNISIVDTADAPRAPSSPNLALNMMIALLAGASIAGLVVLFRDQFDDSIRVPEDVEHKLALPLLGVVPKSAMNPEEELTDPKSALSEAYNSLGGALLYSTSEGLPHVLLVTSAQASEGKSTTSLAIAGNFARIGKRALVIDLDMRRPSLHRFIDSDNKKGMSNLLTSSQPAESVMLDSDQANLKIITSGPLPPSPTELIASPHMQAVIDELAGKFDVVVIDSPPVLGLADAPLLSALVDGVLVVVEADRSRRGTLKSSLRRLRAMRPQLLGAVLTKFDPKKAANRYSEYYGYDYYQYGYEAGQRKKSKY